jgi:hypothetical protein
MSEPYGPEDFGGTDEGSHYVNASFTCCRCEKTFPIGGNLVVVPGGGSSCRDCTNRLEETAAVFRRHIEAKSNALADQIGGSHYKDMKIQPVQFIHANAIGYFEGCAIKYLARWRKKNGVEDLKKAKHFIELLIDLEEGK